MHRMALKPIAIAAASFAWLFLMSCATLFSQQLTSTSFGLAELKSPNAAHRIAAYKKIKGDQAALRRSDVRDALVDLLNRENRFVHKTLEDSDGQEGVGEDFGGYHTDLVQTLMKIADWHDPHQVCAVAESGPEPESRLGAMIASKGGATMIPCLLKIAQGNAYGHQDSLFMREVDRSNSIPMLVQLGAATNELSPEDRRLIREATIGGLRDPELAVREETVRVVGEFGSPDLIPILEEIARSDPYSRPKNDGQGRRFDIRELASQAIRSIRMRGTTP